MSVPKINLYYLRRTLVTVFLLTALFSAGYYFGYKGYAVSYNGYPKVTINRALPEKQKDLDFSLFWRVWDTMSAKYYDKSKLIPSQMVYGAIKGMVDAVGDPYTVFLQPTQNKIVNEDLQGNFGGVGIQIGFKGTQLAVIAPLPDSPAEKVGVKAGDYILRIKDSKKAIDLITTGLSLPDAVEAIRGVTGTKVTLTLVREESKGPFDVDIIRGTINVPAITLSYVGPDSSIAHIKVVKFSSDMIPEWNAKVAELVQKENLKGIIMDVRNNPGGYLQGAVDLSSDFLEIGQTVVVEDTGGQKTEDKVTKTARLKKVKMVVLVDAGSASASEIFAGAIKDNKRGKIVGKVTFGKGTIQEPLEVDKGAGLHITIAKWLTPSGYWVNGQGLKPDYEVEDKADTPEDEQLDKAIEVTQNM